VEKLHHTEQEFWKSSYAKIDFILSQYYREMEGTLGSVQDTSPEVSSMREIIGW